MHKIAFSGVSGSGKSSTLAEAKKLLALKYRVAEVSDLKAGSPFDFDQKTGFVSQFYFLTGQINEENLRALERPDFLLCDGSFLDHWLEWLDCREAAGGDEPPPGGEPLMEALRHFWLPSYAVFFRLRADAAALKKRVPQAGMREYGPADPPRDEERYSLFVQREGLPSFDVWTHRSVDECAQEIMERLGEMKLL